MKTGISTACLANMCETEDAFNLLKEIGVETCEIYLQTFYEYRPEFAQKYAERLNGAEACCVHVNPQNFEPQLFSQSRRVRGDGFYWLDQTMRSVRLFGAKNFIFHGFARTGGGDDFDSLSQYIRGVTEFCGEYGISACLENVSFGLYNRPSVFKELKSRCANLCGVFDLKQARFSGYPYTMYLKDMSGAISLVHLADFDEDGSICLPGEGVTDFKEMFMRLSDEGFDGPVIIDTPNAEDLSRIRRSVEFLKETLYTVK